MSSFRCRLVLTLIAIIGAAIKTPHGSAQTPEVAKSDDPFANTELVVCFEGKGSFVAFDAGVAAEIYRQIPAVKEDRVIVTASSSGAIPAIYFGTHGFNDQSLTEGLDDIIGCKTTFDAIRQAEDPIKKTRHLMMGKSTEMSYNVLREVAGRIMDVEDWQTAKDLYEIAARSNVRFKLPVAIIAVNHEVADNSVPGALFRGREEKVFVPRDFSVAWKPSVYEFYRNHPDRFAENNPDLRLGDSPNIGKACTYFVSESMYELLIRLPLDERLGDLRIMKTPRDIALALMASTGEPTYFQPIEEIDYSLLTAGTRLGDRGNSKRRLYAGGFAMPLVAQDIRRLLPHVRVLGTGSYPFSTSVRTFLRGQYVIDTKLTYALSNWWVDLHTAPRGPEWREITYGMITPQGEMDLGRQRALETFRVDNVFPPQVVRPPLYFAVGDGKSDEPEPLETRRGLGKLIRLQDGDTAIGATQTMHHTEDAGQSSR